MQQLLHANVRAAAVLRSRKTEDPRRNRVRATDQPTAKIFMDVIGSSPGFGSETIGQMTQRKVADQDDCAAVDEIRDRG